MGDPFDPLALLAILQRHEVQYLVIGGFAATAYGSHLPTTDIDITPERSRQNLTRLSAALTEMDARIRTDGAPGGLPFPHDGALLLGVGVLNLVTSHGELDLVMEPAGGATYDQLASRVVVVEVRGVAVPLAALDDVIASKRAASRPKHRAALPTLDELRNRLQESAPD
ncbi:MAG: hypothetical protein WA751_08415 [Candidatus Dormiibacterota bacterium]